jgi:Holliday junction resolvase-like predicted endonuclease
VSRSLISKLELGHVDRVTLRTLRDIAATLGARLDVRLDWNGESLDRLLDADHASLVEEVAAILRSLGWRVAVEASFNIRGERGSIDILAQHPATGTLLVVEVKSVVPDIQMTVATLDRKARLATLIAAERGWSMPAGGSVGRLLVVRESRTARRRVAGHGETFLAAFPHRLVTVRRWLRDPTGLPALSGLLFLAHGRQAVARHRVAGPGPRTPSSGSEPR